MNISTCKTVELPITIEKKDLINDLWKVISILKPQWKQDSVKHKVMKIELFCTNFNMNEQFLDFQRWNYEFFGWGYS
jgi:hypothetical protein